jgi:hypothetical protein
MNDRSRPGESGSEKTIAAVNTSLPNVADWRQNAATVLGVLAHSGMPFHVDDFLMLAGDPPSVKQIGAAFQAAHRRRLIEPVGAAVANDGRLVRVWVRSHR